MTIAANPPSRNTDQSTTNPVEGSASLTSPTTVRGETKKARTTPPTVPTTATKRVLAMLTSTELAPGNAQGAQGGVRLGLNGGLPGQRLGDDDNADQCSQTGQDPPSDRLGVDRVFDHGGFVVEVGDREAPQCLRPSLELGKVGGAMAQLDEVAYTRTVFGLTIRPKAEVV